MGKYDTIKRAFEELYDEENAGKMAAYMRHKFSFYGIPTPARRSVYKAFLREEKKDGRIDWELLDTCWDDPHREFQYFVMDYLDVMSQYLEYEDIAKIRRYVRTRQWWDTIDGLDGIIGRIGLGDKRVSDVMLEWSRDDDFWVRRVAIDHQLTRRERTDTELLEAILVNNFGSNEFFINKAIGWSLREYSKTDARWVRNFIDRHRKDMNPLSIREASKYLK